MQRRDKVKDEGSDGSRMNLPAFCIRRPAFTIVISLVLMIVGLIGFLNLPVRWIPNVNPPIVSVNTDYAGANPKLIEHDITKVIEGALTGINGVESITSSSREGSSSVKIEFELGWNMNMAVEDVRAAVDRVRNQLPSGIDNPEIAKADPGSEAFMYISISDAHRDIRELSDYVDKHLVPSLETIDGVGSVVVYGKRISAMQIKLDPDKMAGANVTVDEVTRLLQEQNSSIPSGSIRGKDRFYSVITDTSLKTAQQFDDLIIRRSNNQTLRLKDIAKTKIDIEDKDSAFRINGHDGLALGFIAQSNANPIDVEKRIKKRLDVLKRSLPAGMQAKIIFNQADYIRASIYSVYEALAEAILFVCLVILAFLCSFRATLVPIVTIPVCLLSSFAILNYMGFSINTITLMAFVLAIGLVVDDAIVMLENITRHREAGLSPYQAALTGSKEIIFPIIAMTCTLVAVYAPVAFTPGLLGVLFREFTFTLAGAVLVSGIVALTLSPMMCAYMPAAKTAGARSYEQWVARQLNRLQSIYKRSLVFVLRKRAWLLLALVLTAVAGYFIYKSLPAELAPTEDQNKIYVHMSTPRDASYKYTDQFVKQMESLYSAMPDVKNYLTINYSAPHSFHVLNLKLPSERQQSLPDMLAYLQEEANKITGARVNVFEPPPALANFAGSDDGDRLGLVLTTSSSYQRLQKASQTILDELRDYPGFVHVSNRLKWNSSQFQVDINRERAADLKVSVPAITNTISTLIAGRKVGKADDANVLVKVGDDVLENPNLFYQLYVRNADNEMVPLSNLLTVKERTAPAVFRHEERMRADTIFATLAPNVKLDEAVAVLEKVARDKLPEDISFSFTGEAKSFLESSGKTAFTFMLALVFIYLILVAQFESFIDPLVILLTVPFAMIGAVATLKLFGGSSNIYSNIGLITLIGLIAKHGILITEFANRLREQGQTLQDAIINASLMRLRPILMTTAAMVLGALPLALAFGPGSESRQQIGMVIAGGMIFGTFYSLFVVPVAYSLLTSRRKLVLASQEKDYATVL